MSQPESITAADRRRRLLRIRGGQVLGLLYLIGPLSDLSDASVSSSRRAAIIAVFVAFVAVYLLVLPPVRALERRGEGAVYAALALLPLTAGLVLALGAPRSFVALFVYVVAAAGLVLPVRLALTAIAVTAAGVGAGLSAAGAGTSEVAAHTLTVLSVGVMLTAFGTHLRTIRELRSAREEIARLAVSEERLRISRDLHDLLGHTLSLVALKSELAAKLLDSEPARARAELQEVHQVSRQALAEVRGAVQGYRRLAFADALEGARAALTAAGISSTVESSDAELPAEIESVFAWAVREATTNVVRHSGARSCRIRVAAEGEIVSLLVDDDGRPPTSSRDGAGLAGIAERARRLHGTLDAGARPEGGFRLRLTVPLRA
jgi:two-component system, NarL family, sensor histidine kinase DesK